MPVIFPHVAILTIVVFSAVGLTGCFDDSVISLVNKKFPPANVDAHRGRVRWNRRRGISTYC